jgi:flagellar biosynthesis/type III secretory pathway protein FliH
VILNKTKDAVRAYKSGYLKGHEEGLAIGQHAAYQEGYKDGLTKRRKHQMRDYWHSYPYNDKKKHWRKSKPG